MKWSLNRLHCGAFLHLPSAPNSFHQQGALAQFHGHGSCAEHHSCDSRVLNQTRTSRASTHSLLMISHSECDICRMIREGDWDYLRVIICPRSRPPVVMWLLFNTSLRTNWSSPCQQCIWSNISVWSADVMCWGFLILCSSFTKHGVLFSPPPHPSLFQEVSFIPPLILEQSPPFTPVTVIMPIWSTAEWDKEKEGDFQE